MKMFLKTADDTVPDTEGCLLPCCLRPMWNQWPQLLKETETLEIEMGWWLTYGLHLWIYFLQIYCREVVALFMLMGLPSWIFVRGSKQPSGKWLYCSETTLTGESRFHTSTPQGIWTRVPCDRKQMGSPLDLWDMVRKKWDCRLSSIRY